MKVTNIEDISIQNELSFEGMIWRLLEQWKIILLTALITSLLFSTFQYYRTLKEAQADVRTNQEIQKKSEDEILEDLPEEDRGMVSSLIKLYRTKKELMDYIANSTYMNLHPADIRAANIEFAVMAEEGNLNTFVDSYVVYLRSASICNSISTVLNGELSSADVNTLTRVSIDSKSSSGLIAYALYLPDGLSSEEVIQVVKAGIKEKQSILESKIGSHTITFIAEEEKIVSDFGITRDQADTYSYLNNMTNQQTALLSNCSSQQKEVYEILLNQENSIQPLKSEEKVSFFNKRIGVLGFILGVVISVIVSILFMIFSRRVQNQEVLKGSGGIRLLGEWYEGVPRNILSKFTCSPLIYRFHYGKHMNFEKELEHTVSVILNTCHHKGISDIVLIGSINMSVSGMKFIQSIMNYLREADINVMLETMMKKDGKETDDALFIDKQGVILVVAEKRSWIEELDYTVKNSNYYDVPILGSVYLG